MPGNCFGKLFNVTTWGESHGKALGAIVDGCPPGISLSEADIQIEIDQRKPGTNLKTGTSRKEEDKVEILSGVFEGKTLGTPISMIVWNKNAKSGDYEALKNVYRPGHADYTYQLKYGIRDYRGGGRSSGRETVARVMAGAIANKLLSHKRISIIGHCVQIGPIKSIKFAESEINNNVLCCADKEASAKMMTYISQIKKEGDSTGGVIEILVKNCPVGLGEPVFDKLEADLAKALMSIGAVKGIEFGKGFKAAEIPGSKNNDPFTLKKDKIGTKSNNAGGILGGISSGEDIIIRIAVKGAASIGQKQTVLTTNGKEKEMEIKGRHDTCIVPRLIPVAKSMVAITLADHLLRYRAISNNG